MTPEEEDYLHFQECIRSLNEAWYILQQVQETSQKSAITAAAYRYALVAYARPYTDSDGIHRNRKRRNAYKFDTLPQNLSPDELRLHTEILHLRHKILVHSDLTVKEAKVYPGRYGTRRKAVIISNVQPSLPDVSAVIELIEHTLDSLYEKRDEQEGGLREA